ncbi:MAG: hypothetical protein E7469_02825 [Ruminococcaceae bacterium]|nr:hypothetical protein [Oscillospiraceae bacterium]
MKKLLSLLAALALCLCLSFALADTAYAGDLDLIRQYDVTVTPSAEDGSLRIRVDFEWEVLDQGPVEWLQIGIPNGSIRDLEALTDNIDSLDFDNSFMYVYFDRGYDDGEVFQFSYAWTQEYMYTLDGSGGVVYDYTPGWFDEARIQCMTLLWNAPANLPAVDFSAAPSDGQWNDYTAQNGFPVHEGRDLGHGAQLRVVAKYDSWPTELFWENSAENLPEDEYYYPDYEYDNSGDDILAMLFFVIFTVVVISIIVSAASSANSYGGGFGTRYVFVHGLWYPAGRDGRPRPGSVGTVKKPSPPRSSGGSRGGFGGGSRGGGFGGGGFGGGGHCACASSCACACACACAGGGRAGCSAKNLYGSVQLDRRLTEKLLDE